jgi:hypothetical protein
MLVGH